MTEPDGIGNEEKATELLIHIKELSKLKYESEGKREQSLISQSSQMQTAFSFVSVAILMLLPICLENRGNISANFFIWATSSVLLLLFTSLGLASIAQWRWKAKTFMDISDIYKFFESEYEGAESEAQRLKQWVIMVGEVQKSTSDINEKRVKLIMASMICFYASLALMLIWVIAGFVKLL